MTLLEEWKANYMSDLALMMEERNPYHLYFVDSKGNPVSMETVSLRCVGIVAGAIKFEPLKIELTISNPPPETMVHLVDCFENVVHKWGPVGTADSVSFMGEICLSLQ